MKPPVLYFSFSSERDVHQCRIELGWLGTERYYVDDKLVFKQRSVLGNKVRIQSNGREIQVKSWIEKRQAVMEIKVDGTLVSENLLEEYNKELRKRLGTTEGGGPKRLSPAAWFLRVAIWFLIATLFFMLFRAIDANAA